MARHNGTPHDTAPRFAVGDLVLYQKPHMTEQRRGEIAEVLKVGYKLTDRTVLADTDWVRKVKDSGGAAPTPPAAGAGAPSALPVVAAAAAATVAASACAAHAEARTEGSGECIARPGGGTGVEPLSVVPAVSAVISKRAVPGTLVAAEVRIIEDRALLAAGANDIALCLAHAHDTFFTGERAYARWLDWCAGFGIERRRAISFLNAGRVLVQHAALRPRLGGITIEKLEILATLDPDQREGLIRAVDVAAMPRDELRRKIAWWKETGHADTPEPEPAAPRRRGARAPTPPGPIAAVAALAALTVDTARADAAIGIDPWQAVLAGYVSLDIALREWQRTAARPTQAQAAQIESLHTQFRAELAALAPLAPRGAA